MDYQRLFLHYGPNQTDVKGVLSQRAVKKCWFELHRLGGCGSGEIRLNDDFGDRNLVEPGDWIACEYSTGDRWYFGRVEQVESESPAGVRIKLEGPAIELNEVFPGAFSPTAAGMKPHRYARTDLFSHDPDGSLESVDVVMNSAEFIRKLLEQYVVPKTKIKYVFGLVEAGPLADDVTSVKFRGEESVRSIIKEMAVRARNASWGVDAEGQFFFLQQNSTVLAEYTENIDLTRLKEVRSRELLFNRVVLTGDYVYDRLDHSSNLARRSFRWRGNYRQPESIATYGERRIRMSVPWIRSREDSRSFVSEFFRIYAQPVARHFFETAPQTTLPVPWLGAVKVLDRDGAVLSQLQPEKIRVQFDHRPRFRMELGPADPRELWPEPPQDERWELPEKLSDYGESDLSSGDPPPPSSNGTSGSQGGGSSGGGSQDPTSLSFSGSSASSGSSGSSMGSDVSSGSSAVSSSGIWSSGGESSEVGTSVNSTSNAGSSGEQSSGIGSSGADSSSAGVNSSEVNSSNDGESSDPAGTSSQGNSSGQSNGSSSGGSSNAGNSSGGSSGGSAGGNSSGAGTSSVGGENSTGQNSSQAGSSGNGTSTNGNTSSAGAGTSSGAGQSSLITSYQSSQSPDTSAI